MTITYEELKRALPDKLKPTLNQKLLDSINKKLSDPNMHKLYRENFLGYLSIMADGKYKMQDYLNAVKYVTHKLMGATNQDAYIKTFPDRYKQMLAKGMSSKEISSYVAIYNRGRLVNAIYEQSLIPSWIINQDIYQKAINVQVELMMTAHSEKVRSDAANSLLNHLKPPEIKKVELDIGLKNNDDIEQLRLVTAELASQQKRLIEAGVLDIQEVAETKLIGRVIEHED